MHAEEEAQRYKIGKYILETGRVVKSGNGWEEDDEDGNGGRGCDEEGGRDDEVEFDSQDEDECEDLFSGVWSPELAKRRRKKKDFRRT